MTPTPCQTLDAYLDGRLTEAEAAAFEAHLGDCETCLAAADADDPLSHVLGSLADVPCPPDVLDRALAEARRQSPDRPPAARRARVRRWRYAALPLAALAVAAAVWTVRPPHDAPAPLATAAPEASAPAAPPASTQDLAARPQPAAPVPSAEATPPPTSEPLAAADDPPTDGPAASPSSAVAAPADTPPAVARAAPADSVRAAKDQLMLAFALVADAQEDAADAVATGVGHVSDALRSTPLLVLPYHP